MSGILQISEATSLALHSMALMAKTNDMLNTNAIADATKASQAHLSKVLQRLSKAELVNSVRGPNGGFCLARPANNINLLEIYETIEGHLESPGCLLKDNNACVCEKCMFDGLLERLTVQFKDYLASHTLADIISRSEKTNYNKTNKGDENQCFAISANRLLEEKGV